MDDLDTLMDKDGALERLVAKYDFSAQYEAIFEALHRMLSVHIEPEYVDKAFELWELDHNPTELIEMMDSMARPRFRGQGAAAAGGGRGPAALSPRDDSSSGGGGGVSGRPSMANVFANISEKRASLGTSSNRENPAATTGGGDNVSQRPSMANLLSQISGPRESLKSASVREESRKQPSMLEELQGRLSGNPSTQPARIPLWRQQLSEKNRQNRQNPPEVKQDPVVDNRTEFQKTADLMHDRAARLRRRVDPEEGSDDDNNKAWDDYYMMYYDYDNDVFEDDHATHWTHDPSLASWGYNPYT